MRSFDSIAGPNLWLQNLSKLIPKTRFSYINIVSNDRCACVRATKSKNDRLVNPVFTRQEFCIFLHMASKRVIIGDQNTFLNSGVSSPPTPGGTNQKRLGSLMCRYEGPTSMTKFVTPIRGVSSRKASSGFHIG